MSLILKVVVRFMTSNSRDQIEGIDYKGGYNQYEGDFEGLFYIDDKLIGEMSSPG